MIRTKEIGIRKVLGASVMNIVRLLWKEYGILLVIANLISWPMAYFFSSTMLRNFPYHIDVGISVFIFAGTLTLIIAMITVSSQAIRAALRNPVNALRYE